MNFPKYESYKDSGVEWLGAGFRKRLNGPFKPQMSQMDTDSKATQHTSHAASVLCNPWSKKAEA